MLTESGMVENPLDVVGAFLFVLADYLFKHTFCFFISDLFSSLLGLAIVPSLLFPFPVLLLPCFSSLPVIQLSVSSSILQAGDHLQEMLRVP